MLVPSWLVLSNKYVWVMQNNKPLMRTVTVGDTIGDKVEILNGLKKNDQLILDPQAIPDTSYTML